MSLYNPDETSTTTRESLTFPLGCGSTDSIWLNKKDPFEAGQIITRTAANHSYEECVTGQHELQSHTLTQMMDAAREFKVRKIITHLPAFREAGIGFSLRQEIQLDLQRTGAYVISVRFQPGSTSTETLYPIGSYDRGMTRLEIVREIFETTKYDGQSSPVGEYRNGSFMCDEKHEKLSFHENVVIAALITKVNAWNSWLKTHDNFCPVHSMSKADWSRFVAGFAVMPNTARVMEKEIAETMEAVEKGETPPVPDPSRVKVRVSTEGVWHVDPADTNSAAHVFVNKDGKVVVNPKVNGETLKRLAGAVIVPPTTQPVPEKKKVDPADFADFGLEDIGAPKKGQQTWSQITNKRKRP